MENKSCPNCIKRVNPKTNIAEFVCKKGGYKKCDSNRCLLERDNYDDNYGMDSMSYRPRSEY